MESEVHSRLKSQLNEASEIEKVALLLGHFQETIVKVKQVVIMENLDKSSTSFSLDHEIMIKEILNHEKKGYNFLGIFHSHPSVSTTQPSQKDQIYMQNWPFPYIWVIGKNQNPSDIQIFTLCENSIFEIPYIVASPTNN